MSVYRVLITDYTWPDLDQERRELAAVDAELVVAPTGAPDEITALAADVDAILTCFKQVPPAALEAAPRCRIVSRYGIGLDNIPVELATRLGMVVTNVPDFCQAEVAEHTLALLLACARRIAYFAESTRAGVWRNQTTPPMARLSGQVLGLVGFGSIGRAVAEKAHALGLRVVAYTPRLTPTAVPPWVTVATDLPDLLRQADYVSLHLPLTPASRGLIDAAALACMQASAYLINTARGAIVDEAALADALAAGRITGAALDVLSQEPPPADHPLLGLENVIVTPHAAFYSAEAIADLATRAALHVAQALAGQVPDQVVNPAVLEQPNCRLCCDGRD